jgi:hypothetical protein
MKQRILDLLLAATLGAFAALTFTACSSDSVGGSSSAVSGAGGACTVDADCAKGLKCEHGICTADDDAAEADDADEHEQEHDAGTAPRCTASTDCAAGQECDDGLCKAGDRGEDGGHDSSGSGEDSSGSGHDSGGGGREGSDG